MTNKNKITFGLATLFLAVAINQASVKEVKAECTVNYGGQVCGASTHTPVATDLDTETLYSLSAVLYSTGLASFVIAKKLSFLH